jgi:hypothetical protein
MEAASQSSHGSYNGGNIETGLSAKDSLALAQSDTHVSHALPSQKKRHHVSHALPSQKKRHLKSRTYCSFSFWTVLIMALVFVVLPLIIVIVILVARNKKPEEIPKSLENNIFDQGDTTDPTLIAGPASSRLQILREMLIPVSGVELLTDPTTPQYAALAWLADDDPAQVDLNDTAFETISDRYKVSLLYFATSGSGWRMQHEFLAETSICEWNDGGEGGAFEGIQCENDEVVEIILGTFPSEEGVVRFFYKGTHSFHTLRFRRYELSQRYNTH